MFETPDDPGFFDFDFDFGFDFDGGGILSCVRQCVLSLAPFLAPVDVYFLAHTCKVLHALSSTALKTSLQCSLGMVMKHHFKSPQPFRHTFEAMRQINSNADPNAPKVVISGSIVVQALLGRAFVDGKTDMDLYSIFCPTTARKLRDALVKDGHVRCVSGDDDNDGDDDGGYGYMSTMGERDGGMELISSVEHYAAKSKLGKVPRCSEYGAAPPDHRRYHTDEYPCFRCGKGGARYELRQKDGGEYLVEVSGMGKALCKSVDLVFGRACEGNVLGMLRAFDLRICAASYDGRTFRIPDPHASFRGETSCFAACGSKYTKDRIKKYERRGVVVWVPDCVCCWAD